MTAERHSVQYGEHRIEFAIVRRERTTLEIAVEPDASVVVAAPLVLSVLALRLRRQRSMPHLQVVLPFLAGLPVAGRAGRRGSWRAILCRLVS